MMLPIRLGLKGGITMSEEQGQKPTHPIVVDTGGSIEFLATNAADTTGPLEIGIAVETIPELISAVRARSSPITYYKPAAPRWLPPLLVWTFLALIVYSVVAYLDTREGMSRGYGVEYTYRGLIPSITLRLSPPSAGDAKQRP
jgi:hypothetical protein